MKLSKILLPIDGSAYSQYAAEVAWRIARQNGATVTALHVVDTASIRGLMGHVEPGFLNPDDYKTERDAILDALVRAAHKLLQNYKGDAQAAGIHVHTLVEYGNPADIISSLAKKFDLVVIGHKPFDRVSDRFTRQLMRLSVAESLAESCPGPLMIVQSQPIDWSSLTIMLSSEHINRRYLDAGVELASQLSLQPALVCLTAGDAQEPPAELIADLRDSDSVLKEVPIAVTGVTPFRDAQLELWDNPTGTEAWNVWEETLLVIPTRPIPGRRLTVADGSPAQFVRFSTLPAVVLYPEEEKPVPQPMLNTARKAAVGG
jgi:nucleotide-binding universal stress UspA family protein